MSAKKNIEFHTGEDWRIDFAARDANGAPIPLDVDVDIDFRISNLKGTTPLLTKSRPNTAIVVDDVALGLGHIVVFPEDQTSAALVRLKTYSYEIKINTGVYISVQCTGELKVLDSLFAVP